MVDLFAPLLGDIEAIIQCSFDFDLKKKIRPHAPSQKKKKRKFEDKQTINFFRPYELKKKCDGKLKIGFQGPKEKIKGVIQDTKLEGESKLSKQLLWELCKIRIRNYMTEYWKVKAKLQKQELQRLESIVKQSGKRVEFKHL